VAFEIGQRVGDYEVVSMLGAGGMGRVYRVRNLISDRTEAMKVLLPDLVVEQDLAGRFISEIRMLASFDHPNIAQFYTAFQVDNQLVMMMEFVEGYTLEQLATQGPLPESDTINYMQQVLSALSYAHGRGVVHRDIKPANIMLTSHGVVKLMDFGIAKAQREVDLTRPGTTMGSLYYMSPEQVRGEAVDARSDIYSIGIMMYELMAGRRPFEADSAYAILNQQCNVAPQPPVEINPQLPAALSEIILCALQKDPANRFQNAQAVHNALCQVAARPDSTLTAEGVPFTPVVIPGTAQPATSRPATSQPPTSQPPTYQPPTYQPPTSQPVTSQPVTSQPATYQPAAAQPAAMAAAPASSSHRGAWITVGALAVLVVLAAAAVGLPHLFHTSAKTDSDSTVPTASGTASVAAPPPAASVAAPPAAPVSPPVASVQPPAAPVPAPTAAPTTPAQTTTGNAPKTPVIKNDRPPTPPRPAYKPGGGTPSEVTKQPDNTGPTAQEVQQAHEQKIQLDSRASSVSASVESLKRQQEAEGLGLRQDMAGAYARMNSYLRLANDNLNNGNIAAASSYMDKADKEISTLESFFGR
jgi:eukaryotic-like serine/threonine-protein kinase